MAGLATWWTRLVDEKGLVALAFVGAGLVRVAAGPGRGGAGLIGGGMVAAGIFRSVMADPGILAIRGHRWIDLCFYYGLGAATIVFALIVPNP